jgi:hypothetical protein
MVGTFIFPDRINDIIPLLSDKGLNKNDPNMILTLKTIILEHFLKKNVIIMKLLHDYYHFHDESKP